MPKSEQRCVTSLSVSSNVPSSSRNSIRSRADILPSLCCLSRRVAPPPSSASESRRLSSASFFSSFMAGNYSGERVSPLALHLAFSSWHLAEGHRGSAQEFTRAGIHEQVTIAG